MSEHRAKVEWKRGDREFGPKYDRDHEWRFDGGAVVAASSAPEMAGNPALVDPERALVASLSACHMMWFLFLVAKQGLVVNSYVDDAVGTMGRDDTGVTWIQRVDLHPHIAFEGAAPTAADLAAFHADAHKRCFIANSLRSEVVIH